MPKEDYFLFVKEEDLKHYDAGIALTNPEHYNRWGVRPYYLGKTNEGRFCFVVQDGSLELEIRSLLLNLPKTTAFEVRKAKAVNVPKELRQNFEFFRKSNAGRYATPKQ